MNSRRHIVIIAVLGVAILALAGGLISMNARVASIQNEKDEVTILHKKVLENLTATQTALDASLTEKENAYDALSKDYQRTSSALEKANFEISALKARLMCSNTIPSVDYTDNITVSSALKEFSSDYAISDDFYYQVKGDNEKTFYHILKSKKYLYSYVVFFTDADMGTLDGIFDISNQCWRNLNNQ
jgi:glutaredoxin 2